MEFSDIFINDTTWEYIFKIVIRCFVMYCLIIVVLRLTGKRGVRQLSIFELAIILCLGSAAGDPMFVKDAPIIQAFTVMCTILLLYRLTTWSMMKNEKIEYFLEGKAIYIVKDGMLVINDLKKEKYSHDEFFSEMRQQHVEHLGQIEYALLETDGCLSIIFYQKDQIKWGLPLFPDQYKLERNIKHDTFYSCKYCGYTTKLNSLDSSCTRCHKKGWIKSMNRIKS